MSIKAAKLGLLFWFLLGISGAGLAQEDVGEVTRTQPTEAYDQEYDFIKYDFNHLLVRDESTLGPFYKKWWGFQRERKEGVHILQLGDSHVQAGFWGGRVRELLHEYVEDSRSGRGFIFPYALAKSNNPDNYRATYTGTWKGCRNAFINKHCEWGVAGVTATTEDDSASFTINTNWNDSIIFTSDRVRIFYPESSAHYELELIPVSGEVLSQQRIDELYTEFELSEAVDSFQVFLKSHPDSAAPFILQGLELLNKKPGLVYSEIGVNGSKVKGFLASPQFSEQLKVLNPDLIIVSLGTNDAYYDTYKESVFYAHYDSLLTIIREALPEASILCTTPGDGKRRYKFTNNANLNARNAIIQLVEKHNAGVWDWFHIMGGMKSIEKWFANDLCFKDHLHLNHAGYKLSGTMLFNALMQGWKEHKPEVVTTESKGEGERPGLKQWLLHLFMFNDMNPLLFSGYLFWGFFSVFFLVFVFIYKRIPIRNFYLLIFSLFFYFKSGGFYFSLLLISTLIDYFIGKTIYASKKQKKRTTFLVLSIFFNLLMLCFFKYTFFFIDSANELFGWAIPRVNILAEWGNQIIETTGWSGEPLLEQNDKGTERFNALELIVPVGISFFTFQTISYTVDIYRRKVTPVKNILDFAFYVSFFPQLVAGPIVRAAEFVPQIYKKYELSKADFGRAIFLIVVGLIKKVLVSDYISVNFVDRVFDAPLSYSGFENLMAVYGYTIQIFCDFSGYTDIAIGLALLLGFRLPLNFNQPYLALNITDFWRRWHISLSSWLKDYLYIPLGGNRSFSWLTWAFMPLVIGALTWIVPDAYKVMTGVIGFAVMATLMVMSLRFPTAAKRIATNINLMLTMLLGGLWHGNTSNFILWGAMHGVALAVHKTWSENSSGTMTLQLEKWFRRENFGQSTALWWGLWILSLPSAITIYIPLVALNWLKKLPKWGRNLSAALLTFHFVALCWILFRMKTMEGFWNMVDQIRYHFRADMMAEISSSYLNVFIVIAIGYLIHYLPQKWEGAIKGQIARANLASLSVVLAVVVFVLYQFKNSEITPFIYFSF